MSIVQPGMYLGDDIWAAFEGDTLVLIQEVAIYDGSPSRIALGPEPRRKLAAYIASTKEAVMEKEPVPVPDDEKEKQPEPEPKDAGQA